MRPILIVLSLFLVAGAIFAGVKKRLVQKPSPSPLPLISLAAPSPTTFETSLPTTPPPSPSPKQEKVLLPQSVRLAVPFSPQAPDADWREPWKEGCEEVALLMADAYNKGDKRDRLPAAETKERIATMVEWEKQRFGAHKDLGVDEVATIAREYLGYKEVTVKHEATIDDLKNVLRRGKPVIIPAAGRLLGNPYFRQPGPIYHMFVVTGFEGEQFITNENGTKQGHNYRYSRTVLERAWHDWQAGVDVTATPRAFLVLEK